MKKAFTLVELLVVVVVLVILMTLTFKLVSVSGEAASVNVTLDRLHRLENALSGYYAAFGTYPPVKAHDKNNPFIAIRNEYQDADGEENTDIWGWVDDEGTAVKDSEKEKEAWKQVQHACLSQPVACLFPFDGSIDSFRSVQYVNDALVRAKSSLAPVDDGTYENIGRFAKYKDETDWGTVSLYKFGLLSFLLPRYIVMMKNDNFYDFKQWTENNAEPRDALTNEKLTWKKMQDKLESEVASDFASIANIPSQAVCARWMANFEKSLCCNYEPDPIFGIQIHDGGEESTLDSSEEAIAEGNFTVFVPGGSDGDTSAKYLLDGITMKDGWHRDLFYYSPPPYQSYILWSAGPNKRTFPPWVPRDRLSGDANRCIGYWVKDDIINMSH